MAQNQPKTGKCVKLKAIPSFFGDVGLTKVVKEFPFGYRSAIFEHVKMGTFGKSAHIRVQKNGTSGVQMKILLPLLLLQV